MKRQVFEKKKSRGSCATRNHVLRAIADKSTRHWRGSGDAPVQARFPMPGRARMGVAQLSSRAIYRSTRSYARAVFTDYVKAWRDTAGAPAKKARRKSRASEGRFRSASCFSRVALGRKLARTRSSVFFLFSLLRGRLGPTRNPSFDAFPRAGPLHFFTTPTTWFVKRLVDNSQQRRVRDSMQMTGISD